MKRFCPAFFLTLAVATLPSLSAQSRASSIHFENETREFGRVTEGELLKHTFRFTNKGTAALEIFSVEPS